MRVCEAKTYKFFERMGITERSEGNCLRKLAGDDDCFATEGESMGMDVVCVEARGTLSVL